MNTIDWVFTVIVALLAVRCFVKGFVREVLSFAAWVVGLIVALLLYNAVAANLKSLDFLSTLPEKALLALGFVLCFVGGFLLMKVVERMVRGGLEAAHLDFFDRLLGLALGIAEGLAVVALVLVIMDLQTFFDVKAILQGSVFARGLLPLVGPAIDSAIRPSVRDFGGARGLEGLLKGTK